MASLLSYSGLLLRKNNDGSIVENSEKNIISFSERRIGNIGYENFELGPESDQENPSIVGHKIKIESEQQVYFLFLVGKYGNVIPDFQLTGSERNKFVLN